MNKSKFIDSNLKKIFLGNIPHEYKEKFSQIKLKTNINHALSLSVFIIVIQIFLNLLNILKPQSTSGPSVDVMKYVYLSLLVLLIGIFYLTLFILVRKDKITSKRIQIFLPYSLLYIYVFIQLIFTFFNLENNSWMSSYMIALLILSFGIIRSPIHSTSSILAIFTFTLFAMYATRLNNDAWNIAVQSDTWATIIIITFLCNYMSIVIYNLYYTNVLSSLKLEQINDTLSLTAKTDALTGLYNRFGFYDRLENNLLNKAFPKSYIAVAMFDLDYFKQYNDKYGHLEGDACLKNVSNVLQSCFDEVKGVVCRYGGEEFLAIFYADSREEAFQIAEDCRIKISKIPTCDNKNNIPITISVGLTCASTSNKFSSNHLISIADKAVYKAKVQGRNSTVFID